MNNSNSATGYPLRSGGHWKVELGCGKKPAKGPDEAPLIGVDWHDFGQAIQADLDETPWTWVEDDACALVVCHQTLEHINDLIPVMDEIWRITEDSGFVEIVVPYGLGKAAIQDPTHVRFFTEDTFRYWEPGYVAAFGDYGINHFFAMCGQRWEEAGNLWTLLTPLKDPGDEEDWKEERQRSFEKDNTGLPFVEAPPHLLLRADRLVGGPAVSVRRGDIPAARFKARP